MVFRTIENIFQGYPINIQITTKWCPTKLHETFNSINCNLAAMRLKMDNLICVIHIPGNNPSMDVFTQAIQLARDI